jgi:hypothetical protein
MNAYQVYLKGELAKLRRYDDAHCFINQSGCADGAFGLQLNEGWLARRFATQAGVDSYVGSLDEPSLVELTARCGQWRQNDVAVKLRGRHAEFLPIAAENVLVCQAEPCLGPDFARLGSQLVRVAQAPAVLAAAAYRDKGSCERIDFRWCLAEPVPGRPGVYRIFDGVHRAIQMVRNGETHIPLCVVSS